MANSRLLRWQKKPAREKPSSSPHFYTTWDTGWRETRSITSGEDLRKKNIRTIED